jgi:hypothetical protein
MSYITMADFQKALYDYRCPTCDAPVDWEADFDADGTNYHARCCKNNFFMQPATVTIEIEQLP